MKNIKYAHSGEHYNFLLLGTHCPFHYISGNIFRGNAKDPKRRLKEITIYNLLLSDFYGLYGFIQEVNKKGFLFTTFK